MSAIKKKPRKSKLVVRDDLPMEVQTYQELEIITSQTEYSNNSPKQFNDNNNVLIDIKVENLSDIEESDNDGWSADTQILVHNVKKEVIAVDEEDTEIDGYEDVYIKKEIKEEPIDNQELYKRIITSSLNKYKEITKTDDELNNFKCSNCNKIFNSITEFQDHLEVMHGDETVKVVLEETDGVYFLVAKPNDVDVYNCNCKLIFHSKEQYDVHSLKCKKCFQCDICNDYFPGKVPYDIHFLIYHRVSSFNEMPVELENCTLCGDNFVGDISLHWCRMRTNVSINCKYCKKDFQTNAFLNVHLTVMAKIEAKCDKCHLSIERECQLNHKCVNRHKFECTFCSKVLSTDAVLKEHILEMHTVHGKRSMPAILKKSKKRNGYFMKISKPSELGLKRMTELSNNCDWSLRQRHLQILSDAQQKKAYSESHRKQFENSYHDYIETSVDYAEHRYNNLMNTIIKDEPMDQDEEPHLSNQIIPTASIKVEDVIKEEIISTKQCDTVTEKTDKDISAKINELINESSDYIRIYKCAKCNFYGVHRDYAEHKSGCKVQKDNKKPKNIPCTKCESVFATPCTFVSHYVREGCAPLQCFDCDELLDNKVSYENHVYSHLFSARNEAGVVTFKCNLCNSSIDRLDYYKHWLYHIDVDSLKCETMEQLLKVNRERLSTRSKGLPEKLSDDQIKTMYQILTTPKKTTVLPCKCCCYCDKAFSRVDYVKIHIIEHLLADAYLMKQHFKALTCQFCLENFHAPDVYKLHMRGHGLLKVYRCKLCSKTFSDSSNFSKHKKVHNLLVLVCDLCNKRFASKKMLIRHFQTEHANNKKYICRYCAKEFPCTSYYKKHIRLFHLGTSIRYMCATCKQRFSHLKDKWIHMWKEHGERSVPADCPACDAKFRRYQDLKTHLKINHHDMPDITRNKVLQAVRASSKKSGNPNNSNIIH